MDSRYEPGQRSRSLAKNGINQGQEFVIGGYTPSPKNFDALMFGYFYGDRLVYATRTRAGFAPPSRAGCFGAYARWRSHSALRELAGEDDGALGQGMTKD
jgi:hypothetical protein